MRLYSAYINRQAAKDANSLFEPVQYVKRIKRRGEELWEFTIQEEKDDAELESAERNVEIRDIEREQKEELSDIEAVVNRTFNIIRDSVLLIHTQLHELKHLVREDEVLKQSGFPIEVADELEEMLTKETANIIAHLREMAEDIEHEDTDDSEPEDAGDFPL